jgi:F-type H+-transporting ATPase subunit delta
MANKNDKRIEYLARSFLYIGLAENSIEKLEKELLHLKNIMDRDPVLKGSLADESIGLDMRVSSLLEALGNKVSAAMKAAASTLIVLDLFDHMEDICNKYAGLINDLRKQVDVEVISAVKLDKKTIEMIKDKVDKKTNLDSRINNIIDGSILGGIIIQVNDSLIDLSIKGKMEAMKENLKSRDLRGEDFVS